MTYEEALQDVIRWTEEMREHLDSKQVASILLYYGALISFECAPDEKMAHKLIEVTTEMARETAQKQLSNPCS